MTPETPQRETEDEGDPHALTSWWRATPIRSDPWQRWPAGEEPIRELTIVAINADASGLWIVRNAAIEIEPGVLPTPVYDPEGEEHDDLRFLSRWNASWRGARLSALSLDLFSPRWDDVPRLVFDPADRVDLLCAYHASYPGLNGITVWNSGTTERYPSRQPVGHTVTCRDPRLALRIAARYPGVAGHAGFFAVELQRGGEPEQEPARELMHEFRDAAKSVAHEPAPGANAALDLERLGPMTRLLFSEFEPPPSFTDPLATCLDTFSVIAIPALATIADATLARVDRRLVDSLAARVNFGDAIEAIRRSEDRGPLWIDFTDDDGQPQHRLQPGGVEQPLYGALVYFDAEDEAGPMHIVAPVGRSVQLADAPLPLCVLAIGPDDRWRYPIPDDQISILTAHSGGVVVRHVRTDWEYEGVQPPISEAEFDRELARCVQRQTEWVLARVGAVLSALADGALLLQRIQESERTYELVPAPRGAASERAAPLPDAMTIARRLRELGSLHRVAEAEGFGHVAAYDSLERAGIDPDQVLRDEVLLRWRRSFSIEAVTAATRLQRDLVERYLLEAGIDVGETPVPHDLTDPDVLAAISAYATAGTLDDAGERLGVSGETVRRRIGQSGVGIEAIQTEPQRRVNEQTVEAWERLGRNLAAAARDLGIDPRTVRQRLRRAGVPERELRAGSPKQALEAAALTELLGSPNAAAAALNIDVRTLKGRLPVKSPGAPASQPRSATTSQPGSLTRRSRGGRRGVSDEELAAAEAALAQHGSVRAAARALGLSTGGMAYRLQLARQRTTESEAAKNPSTGPVEERNPRSAAAGGRRKSNRARTPKKRGAG
jgi:hypothetical protein